MLRAFFSLAQTSLIPCPSWLLLFYLARLTPWHKVLLRSAFYSICQPLVDLSSEGRSNCFLLYLSTFGWQTTHSSIEDRRTTHMRSMWSMQSMWSTYYYSTLTWRACRAQASLCYYLSPTWQASAKGSFYLTRSVKPVGVTWHLGVR
jgi:hypothetical protein